nr:Uncharacterised protein [Providencia rettgeri]
MFKKNKIAFDIELMCFDKVNLNDIQRLYISIFI